MLWETNSATPQLAGPGLALAATRDAAGRLWLHALLRGARALADVDWARQAAGLALQLSWHRGASPQWCPIAPGLAFAGELALERGRELAAHVPFGQAFAIDRAAPHSPCHVRLVCGALTPVALALDPARLDALPQLEVALGDTGDDARLRARLAPAQTDLRARLDALERALQAAASREHRIGAPLLEAIRAALALADAGENVHGHRARATAWAHELLDRVDAHRQALRIKRGHTHGWQDAWLAARLDLNERLWRDLTGGEPGFAAWLASPHGRSVAARAHSS